MHWAIISEVKTLAKHRSSRIITSFSSKPGQNGVFSKTDMTLPCSWDCPWKRFPGVAWLSYPGTLENMFSHSFTRCFTAKQAKACCCTNRVVEWDKGGTTSASTKKRGASHMNWTGWSRPSRPTNPTSVSSSRQSHYGQVVLRSEWWHVSRPCAPGISGPRALARNGSKAMLLRYGVRYVNATACLFHRAFRFPSDSRCTAGKRW